MKKYRITIMLSLLLLAVLALSSTSQAQTTIFIDGNNIPNSFGTTTPVNKLPEMPLFEPKEYDKMGTSASHYQMLMDVDGNYHRVKVSDGTVQPLYGYQTLQDGTVNVIHIHRLDTTSQGAILLVPVYDLK